MEIVGLKSVELNQFNAAVCRQIGKLVKSKSVRFFCDGTQGAQRVCLCVSFPLIGS